VQEVYISINGEQYSAASLRDRESIEKAIAIHRYAVEHRAELEATDDTWFEYLKGRSDADDGADDVQYGGIYLTYAMKNGSTVRRWYNCLFYADDLEREGTITNTVAALVDSPTYRAYNTIGAYLYAADSDETLYFTDAGLSYYINGTAQYLLLTAEQAEPIYRALLEDAAADRMPKIYLVDKPDDYDENRYANELYLGARVTREDGTLDNIYCNFTLTHDMTATLTALEETGVLRGDVQLQPRTVIDEDVNYSYAVGDTTVAGYHEAATEMPVDEPAAEALDD
jgi:hypothetical protein